ncbi:hypothetical protein Cgig2_017595 [Carnegiea gigantea]|uniref:Uncharacterized protein n=1 Tax=Carnegiea gigantea TaxID=171969 RepID=A0A9Q1KMG1_9CARY|nr:hypothetical protein Cgig2_017595 [Carnegiea gigantea]
MIEGTKVLSVCYEGRRIFIKNVNLDKYQILDLHRDAKRKIRKAWIELPEYFGFMHYGPGSKRKLLLESGNDWVHLSTFKIFTAYNLEDIDVGLGRLSSYDLRSLSHSTSASHYDAVSESGLNDKDEEKSGSDKEETDADSEDDIDSEVGCESGSDGTNESLVDLNEVHDDDIDSDIE